MTAHKRDWDIRTDEPMVSVCVQTYQQVNYIRECLEGILMQETDFPFELLLHDDASTDGTAEICQEYAEQYPRIILPILQKENQYSQGLGVSATYQWPRARGRYIAFCEGDDYWTDPLKLQKQVDFLEANSGFSICFHAVKLLRNGVLIDDDITNVPSEESGTADIIKENYIHTPSLMFRNQFDGAVPSYFTLFPIGDYPLHCFNAQFGKIKYLTDVMAVYRVHSGGMWSGRAPKDKALPWFNMRALMYEYWGKNPGMEITKEKAITSGVSAFFSLLHARELKEAALVALRVRRIDRTLFYAGINEKLSVCDLRLLRKVMRKIVIFVFIQGVSIFDIFSRKRQGDL